MRRLFLVALLLLLALPLTAEARSRHREPARSAEPAAAPAPAAAAAAAPVPDPPASRPAEPVPDYRVARAEASGALGGDLLRPALALAVVLALLGLGVKLVRRWPGLLPRAAGRGPLEVLGRLPLGGREAVCLVRAGGECLVLGVSAAGVSLLHRLPPGGLEGLGATRSGSEGPGRGLPMARVRDLATRIRDVQAAWERRSAGAGK